MSSTTSETQSLQQNEKPTRQRRLSKKQREYAREYAATGNGVRSALAAYDTDSYTVAAAISSENLNKPLVRMAIADALPDELLAERHKELLNKREIHRTGYGEDTEWELTDQPDTQAVSKALDMAYKLKGAYAPEKHVSVNVDIDAPELKELTEKLNAIHRGTSISSDGGATSAVGTEVQDKE